MGDEPTRIEDVYLHEGVPFIDIEEAFAALEIGGDWDSVEHVYRFRTNEGRAEFYPGGPYLVVGQRYIPLEHSPRFIDGRLRIPEDFITVHLADLIAEPIHYRNFDPPEVAEPVEDEGLDSFFSFLLRKKEKKAGSPVIEALAIDPGHGGADPGVIGPDGVKEKDVNLAVAGYLEKLAKMELGVPVYLSRDQDYSLSREERLGTAARPEVDVFVLLHAQASFDPSRRGVTLVVRSDKRTDALSAKRVKGGSSRRLAEAMERALKEGGFEVNDVIEAPLLPLGRGDLPTVLVEMGYLSNPADRMRLQDPEHQQRLARALLAGVKSFNTKTKESE